MALKKAIRQNDGVITNYHRILFIELTVNSHNSIAVLSYVDDDARAEEQNENREEIFEPYKRCITYETDYDPSMTIEKAYEYIKTLPEFENAENV